MQKSKKRQAVTKEQRAQPSTSLRKGESLSAVTLNEFTFDKDSVSPFESARLRWKVGGPRGMTLRLNGTLVPSTGAIDVQPAETKTYRLIAMLDGESRHLGSAVLALSSAYCVSSASTSIDEFLAGVLTQKIMESDDLYFRLIQSGSLFGGLKYVQSTPIISFEEGAITFRLKLAARVNNFPDPTVDVVGRFGLKVVPGDGGILSEVFSEARKVVPENLTVDVKVTFPWHAYLVPIAAVALPIAESMAEDKTRKGFTDGIHEFVASVLNWPSPQSGLVKHAARIYVDDDDLGTVEIEFCPPPQPEVDPGPG